MINQRDRELFEDLFVLELANNHLGNLERGKKIIKEFGTIIRYNSVKAAIKLQFRNVDDFIHPAFKGNKEIRYIKKTEATKLDKYSYKIMVDEIRKVGCIPMATPFDEASVDLCDEFNLPIIKIASSDINDWFLIEKIASTKRPVIVSTGGASEKDMDDLVLFFERRNIPLAINHCVSIYPSEDFELELDQIDYLRWRYPEHVIGFSSHEYHDWSSSMLISYAKGARTWERHIDIDYDGVAVSPYCSLPHQIDAWFKAYKKAREMCGGNSQQRRIVPKKEEDYLISLVRGVYSRKDIKSGYIFSKDNVLQDFYLAIPLQKGQLSCREIMNGEELIADIKANEPLTINHINGPYHDIEELRNYILNRGI